MKKIYRLKSNSQYTYVYKRGSVLKNKTLTLIFVKNNSSTVKFGFNITSKYGKATKRNFLRRRLKSICSDFTKDTPHGFYVFRPRFKSEEAPDFLVLKSAASELIDIAKTNNN